MTKRHLTAFSCTFSLVALVGTVGCGSRTTPATPAAPSQPQPGGLPLLDAPVVTVPAEVLGGATATASVPAHDGFTYAWTITGGTITSGAGTSQITFTAGTSGIIQLACTETNASGAASRPGFAALQATMPAGAPVITAPSHVEAGTQGLTASVPAQAGVTYAWTITGGTITSGAATNQITFTAGPAGMIGLSCAETSTAGVASPLASTTLLALAPATFPLITAPATVTAGSAGLTASVPARAGSTFAWTITGGTITAGGTTDQITFTAGPSGILQLTCTETDAAGIAGLPGFAALRAVAPGVTPVITAPGQVTAGTAGLTASVAPQAESTYAWTITGGTITAGADTPRITFTAGDSGTVELSCTVRNLAGSAAPAGTATLTLVAPGSTPVIMGPASAQAGATGLTASVPLAAGSTYAWTITGGTITSGAGTNQITFSAGTDSAFSLTCTETNEAGTPSAPGSLTGAISPVITFFGVSSPAITQGSGTILTFNFLGGSGTVTPGDIAVASGGTLNVSPAATTTYTLSVVNGAGLTAVPQTRTVTVTPAPVITRFLASAGKVFPGTRALLTATFSGGLGAVNHGVGGLLSDIARWTAPLSMDTDFILAVKPWLGGPEVNQQAHVGVWQSLTLAAGDTTAFQLSGPYGVAVDGNGSLYVAEQFHHVIEKFTPTTVNGITTWQGAVIAGIPDQFGWVDSTPDGPPALFNNPMGVAVDQAGNVYVADTQNFAVRMIVPTASPTPGGATTWTVSTVAGSPSREAFNDGPGQSASFGRLGGIAVDAKANLYVTDQDFNMVRMLTPSSAPAAPNGATTWMVSTLAGNGTPGLTNGDGLTQATFYGPMGLALDTQNNLFVADRYNGKVRLLTPHYTNNPITWTVSTLPSGAQELDNPIGLAVDAARNVYLTNSNRVQVFRPNMPPADPGWTLEFLAGGGVDGTTSGAADGVGANALFSFPTGVALGGSGKLYVTDTYNNSLRTITVGSSQVDTIVGGLYTTTISQAATRQPEDFILPNSAVVDQAGNVYVSDRTTSTIRMMVPATPGGPSGWTVKTIAGVANVAGSADTGNLDDGVAHFNGPMGLAIDDAGHIFVADSNKSTVRMLTPQGAFPPDASTTWVVTTIAGEPGVVGNEDTLPGQAAHFYKPASLAMDRSGVLYVGDSENHTIRKLVPTTPGDYTAWTVSTFAGVAGHYGTLDGPAHNARFQGPEGLAVGGNGTLYVADSSALRMIEPTQVNGSTQWKVTTFAGTTNPAPWEKPLTLQHPVAVAIDRSGQILAVDSDIRTVFQITPPVGASGWVMKAVVGDPASYINTTLGPLPGTLLNPTGIALDPNTGQIFVTVPYAVLAVQ